MRIVFDTSAWVEYLDGSKIGLKVRNILDDKKNEIFTSIITLAELASTLKRLNSDVDFGFKIVIDSSKIIFLNQESAKGAGILHAETRKKVKDFGMADAIILVSARELSAKLLTRDSHFKGFKEAILI